MEWKSSILQEYAKHKAECARKKVVGKPYEGKPHVRFDVAGAGNGSRDTAPDLDPTDPG